MLSGFRFDRSGRSLRGRNPWFCRHLHAGFYFLNALDDHFLAGFQAEVITQSVPTRGPTCTGRISAFPSVPTMAS